MRTIIAGSRDIHDPEILEYAITAMRADPDGWTITEILSGGAPGVDKLGETWADEHQIPYTVYPADWNRYGRSAGPMRNCVMAANADALIAIWDGESRGTKHMIETARRNGLRVVVYYPTTKGLNDGVRQE